jgi:CheY-like chemotaxis protein
MNRISALVVDDNEIDRYILQRHLRQCGVEHIVEQDDGSSALQFLKDFKKNRDVYGEKFPPSIIFLDINMPNINGFDFLDKFSELRTEHNFDTCVIMMYSSSEREEDRRRAREFDFVQEYLVKGEITAEQLKDKIMPYVKSK